MLKCKDVAHNASELVDNRLRWYQKLPWYLHLLLCSNCRRFVHQLRLTLTSMQRMIKRTPASEDTIERVIEALQQEKNSSPKDHT